MGPNLTKMTGWRDRLVHAARFKSYREIADNAIGLDGRPMAHTTVRSVFIGDGGVTIETLAAICDALGVSVAEILCGEPAKPKGLFDQLADMIEETKRKPKRRKAVD